MNLRMKRPSTALVVAMVALFVALGGTAGAVVTAAVPLAKRALVADNAKKVGGVTAAQLGGAAVQLALKQSPAGPRPASTAASLVASKSTPFNLAADAEQVVTASCDAGSKAVGGGFNNPTSALVISAGSFATSDGSGWSEDLINLSSSTAGSGTVVVMCLK